MDTERLIGADARWLIDGDKQDLARITSLATLPATERNALLAEFAAAAESGGTREAHLLALALGALGHHESAISVLRTLLDGHPDLLSARLNLAVLFQLIDLPAVALEELERVVADAEAGPLKTLAGDRLRHLRDWQAAESARIRFQQVRLAALRERDQYGESGAADLHDLGSLLLTLAGEPSSPVSLPEAVTVLERARAAAPENPQVLEKLTVAYSVTGRDDEASAVLRTLEEIAPHSPELDRARLSGPSAAATRAFGLRKLLLLDEVARSGGPSPATVEAIRELVKKLPDSPDYKAMLMFSVWVSGDLEEALRLADELTLIEDIPHNIHFNVAQVYWAAGRREEAERHLSAAEETALDDSDRADVTALRELLEGGDRAG
ncbi:tetratricopeptide repeat protein [Streptomyces lutosisoli]|uniref:Tetratricopeptide repeat protein n=1 Tax=Streptomyces lutosisoli TaxID=2665721 RepID=A0ABW2VKT5_9ACTN